MCLALKKKIFLCVCFTSYGPETPYFLTIAVYYWEMKAKLWAPKGNPEGFFVLFEIYEICPLNQPRSLDIKTQQLQGFLI